MSRMKKLERMTPRQKTMTTIITVICLVIALVVCFPFYWMILTSFKDPDLINAGDTSIFTTQLTLSSYKAAFTYSDGLIWRAYLNSIFVAGVSTIGTLFTSSLAAFAFAKIHFKGSKALYSIFVATLMVPGQVTMLPLFMMFAMIGWTNTFLPLILPTLFINTYGVFMLHSFIVSIPGSLLEAAQIDGYGWFKTYWKVVLPLLKPALITLGLFAFIGSWNNYMGALIYLSDESLTTIPLYIAGLRETHMTGVEWGRVMAASTLAIVPLAIVYLACQKYFVQGIATTGIK